MGGCLIAPIYRPKNAEEGYKRTEMYALQYVAQGRCYTGLNAYLTESMTRYVLGNEKSTFNSSNAVVNPRIAKTIGVKSTGGVQRVQWENYVVNGLPENTSNETLSKIIFDSEGNKTEEYEMYRIRKLTPKECWRLMGFSTKENGVWDDEAFNKAEQVNSNTQLYKQAGNSIVVPVLEAIFKEML